MSSSAPPFDDTVQLEVMEAVDYFDDSDTAPIVSNAQDNHSVPRENENSYVAVVEPSGDDRMDENGSPKTGKLKAYITISTLLLINLLNYMDRFTVAGVLIDVQGYYNIGNGEAGLIQTSFICTYMVFSPIFGYLGDRYTRKYLMAVGIFLWSGFTLSASFIPGDKFWAFVMLRALVGVGEASYSTIAPTIIADLFAKEMRTRMLMVFYFAIPVGSGLGYIVGSKVAELFGHWQYALRVTPFLGVICVVLIIIFCQEPQRGMSEGGSSHLHSTGFFADLKAIFKNKSFMLSTVGFTCVAFVTGSLALWAPTFMTHSIVAMGGRGGRRWALIFVGETFLCLNWAVTADILLYVVIPTRRSTAEAVQILISHAFGDAGSPYLIGVVADSLAPHFKGSPTSASVQFATLQYALYITTFVCVIGGGFYLATAIFVERDKNAAQRQIKEMQMKTKLANSSDGLAEVDVNNASINVSPPPE